MKKIVEAVDIFIAGLGGVFFGMALLYVSIRLIALVTDRWFKEKEEK